jgi:hypothetical protein
LGGGEGLRGDHKSPLSSFLDLVQPARLELALVDPQVRRELGIVATHLIDETLGVLAAAERLDGVTERVVGLVYKDGA